jgi:hypothetical protein
MRDHQPEKDSAETTKIKEVHVVERTSDMSVEEFIASIREKVQYVLSEGTDNSNDHN